MKRKNKMYHQEVQKWSLYHRSVRKRKNVSKFYFTFFKVGRKPLQTIFDLGGEAIMTHFNRHYTSTNFPYISRWGPLFVSYCTPLTPRTLVEVGGSLRHSIYVTWVIYKNFLILVGSLFIRQTNTSLLL